MYFVSKVLQGPKVRYQALEKAALAVVFSARRLRHYFQSFTVLVMTDLPIQKVLKKPDVAGRMVKWAVELSEFDLKYEPRGSRGKSWLISWSSCLPKQCKTPRMIFVGCSRWMGRLTSWVAGLGLFWRDPRCVDRAITEVCF